MQEQSVLAFQERNFLLLRSDDDPVIRAVKQVLKSPLGLAGELIRRLNESSYEDLAQQLDLIKRFVAGVARAEAMSGGYGLAHLYPSLFAFHQFFHSSFRARQGKALEEILRAVLKVSCANVEVANRLGEAQKLVQKSLGLKKALVLDMDVLAKKEEDGRPHLLIIQIRSRDDTGGTTAKGSLVDYLRALLHDDANADYALTYLVAIWDARDSQQKGATVSKMFASLERDIGMSKGEFHKALATGGVSVTDRITLRLAYGVDEITDALAEFCGGSERKEQVGQALQKAIAEATNWDDLWVAYAISSLELENYLLRGVSNMEVLSEILKRQGVSLNKSFDEKAIDALALRLVLDWSEPTIPVRGLSDQIHYVRDLLYLRLIYSRVF